MFCFTNLLYGTNAVVICSISLTDKAAFSPEKRFRRWHCFQDSLGQAFNSLAIEELDSREVGAKNKEWGERRVGGGVGLKTS